MTSVVTASICDAEDRTVLRSAPDGPEALPASEPEPTGRRPGPTHPTVDQKPRCFKIITAPIMPRPEAGGAARLRALFRRDDDTRYSRAGFRRTHRGRRTVRPRTGRRAGGSAGCVAETPGVASRRRSASDRRRRRSRSAAASSGLGRRARPAACGLRLPPGIGSGERSQSGRHRREGRAETTTAPARCQRRSTGGSTSSGWSSSRARSTCRACLAARSMRRRSRQCSTSGGGIGVSSIFGQSKDDRRILALEHPARPRSSNASLPTLTPGGVRYQ